ncbi:MAG: flagellar basal body P-ring formation chaperone FlgA [Pseudomonadota bacterium]
MLQKTLAGLLTLLTAIPTAAAVAEDALWQSVDSLATAAEQLVSQRLTATTKGTEITADRPDRRLRLKQCDKPLGAAFLGQSTGARLTVEVSCAGPVPWRIYVPVRVRQFADVVVARNALVRGTVVSAADIVLERRDLNVSGSGGLKNLHAVIGKELAYSVQAGTTLTPRVLKQTQLIERGAEITLLAGTGALTIRTAGTAISAGAAGERIRVRNSRSGRIVEGRIENANEVRIGR